VLSQLIVIEGADGVIKPVNRHRFRLGHLVELLSQNQQSRTHLGKDCRARQDKTLSGSSAEFFGAIGHYR
jgi:hypothetical protein